MEPQSKDLSSSSIESGFGSQIEMTRGRRRVTGDKLSWGHLGDGRIVLATAGTVKSAVKVQRAMEKTVYNNEEILKRLCMGCNADKGLSSKLQRGETVIVKLVIESGFAVVLQLSKPSTEKEQPLRSEPKPDYTIRQSDKDKSVSVVDEKVHKKATDTLTTASERRKIRSKPPEKQLPVFKDQEVLRKLDDALATRLSAEESADMRTNKQTDRFSVAQPTEHAPLPPSAKRGASPAQKLADVFRQTMAPTDFAPPAPGEESSEDAYADFSSEFGRLSSSESDFPSQEAPVAPTVGQTPVPSPRRNVSAQPPVPPPRKDVPAQPPVPPPRGDVPAKSPVPSPRRDVSAQQPIPSPRRDVSAQQPIPPPRKDVPVQGRVPAKGQTQASQKRRPPPPSTKPSVPPGYEKVVGELQKRQSDPKRTSGTGAPEK